MKDTGSFCSARPELTNVPLSEAGGIDSCAQNLGATRDSTADNSSGISNASARLAFAIMTSTACPAGPHD